jgi:predicted DNA-binding protein
MSRIAQINLRVRPSLKAKLEKLAKQDRRTLSAYVEKVLEDHVTEQERRRAKQAFKERVHDAPDTKGDGLRR